LGPKHATEQEKKIVGQLAIARANLELAIARIDRYEAARERGELPRPEEVSESAALPGVFDRAEAFVHEMFPEYRVAVGLDIEPEDVSPNDG